MATNELLKQGTLLDVMNRRAPDGNLLVVAEVLQKETPIIKDAPWVEANDLMQHIYSRRTLLPKSEQLKFNKGVGGNIGATEQETSGIQARGNWPSYDARLVDMAPNKQEYRNTEARATIMGIGQDIEKDLIYGSKAADTCAFDGIESYCDALGTRVISAGGSSNLTSAYIVAWDTANGAYLVYPKGSQGGIKFEDKGERTRDMADGTKMRVYEDYVEVSTGLCVADLRAVARIANIDISAPTASTFDENDVILLLNRMPASLRAKAVMYVSRNLHAAIEMRANAKNNVYYTPRDVFGETLTTIRGLPVRLDEIISENEDVVA